MRWASFVLLLTVAGIPVLAQDWSVLGADARVAGDTDGARFMTPVPGLHLGVSAPVSGLGSETGDRNAQIDFLAGYDVGQIGGFLAIGLDNPLADGAHAGETETRIGVTYRHSPALQFSGSMMAPRLSDTAHGTADSRLALEALFRF